MSSVILPVSQYQHNGVYIAQFKTKMLAVFTYYVESYGEAYIIDPTFDYLCYKLFTEKRGATLKYVVLTHYHADFIAGHTQFNVPVIMGPNSKREVNQFDIHQLAENETFKIGKSKTRVISTPGHTLQSSCYIIGDQNEKQFAIFTGDTVFINQVGRPDLAVKGNLSVQDLAGMLFQSIQKIKTLDPQLRMYPAHGSGSACGKTIGQGNFCLLKNQFIANYAFSIKSKEQFTQKLTKDLSAPPSYFFYDATMNQKGCSDVYEDVRKKAEKPLSHQEIQKYIQQGKVIIDTRHNPVNGIIKGSYWVTVKSMICQIISHVTQPQKQLVIIADEQDRNQIIERLIRVGFHNILGYNNFDMKEWKGETVKANIKKVQDLDPNIKKAYIDVRNKPELIQTGMFKGALFIPIPQFKKRLNEVADFIKNNQGSQIVIHCRTAMRARLGAGLVINNGLGPITVLDEVVTQLPSKGCVFVPYQQK